MSTLVWWWLWAGVVAQQMVTITVIDGRTAAPLPGVHVQLRLDEEGGAAPLTTHSDAAGVATLRAVPAGRYIVTVSTLGYALARHGLVVTNSAPAALTVPLADGTGAYQEDVTVKAAASGAAEVGVSSQASLGAAAIADVRGIATDDAMRAMQTLPGVVTGDDFQAEFSVRGSAFRHVGVVIDDTPSPLLLHAVRGRDDSGSLAMVNADVLDRASLLAGPHPQRHGEWLGATVDFAMRPGARDRLHGRAAVSGTSASLILEGPVGQSRRAGWLVTARKSYVDWLIRKIDPDIESTIGFVDGQAKLSADIGRRQSVDVLVLGGQAIYREPNAGAINGIAKAVSTGGLASAAWRRRGDRTSLSQRFSISSSKAVNSGQSAQVLARGITTTRLWRGDVTHAIGLRWLIEGGARAELSSGEYTLSRYVRSGSGVRLSAQRAADGTRRVWSGWSQVSRRGTATSLAAGVRVSRANRPVATWAAPWVLAEHRLGPLVVRAGAGAVKQLPSLEIALSTDDVAIPERAQGVDVGIEMALPGRTRLQVTAFGRREHDLIRPLGEEQVRDGAFVAQSLFPLWATRLEGTSRGIDVVLHRTPPAGASGFSGWVSYSWARTRHTDGVTGEVFDADLDQRHTINVFLQQRLSHRSLINAKVRAGSNVPLVGYFDGTVHDLRAGTERNRVRLPWYVRVDVRANRAIRLGDRRLTLFLEVVNASGRRNLGQTDGFFTSALIGQSFVEKLIPRIPSLGVLFEF